LFTTDKDSLDLGGEGLLDASIGAPEAAIPLLKNGEITVDLTDYSKTLSCSKCIRSSNVFVYNHQIRAPTEPVV